jgi:hypothetical protein
MKISIYTIVYHDIEIVSQLYVYIYYHIPIHIVIKSLMVV